MRERAIQIGSAPPLAGIVTEPPVDAGDPTVAVIILNAGVLHRVGANRLNVTLARRLAEEGLLAVRFDAAGIGESVSRGPRASPLRPEVSDAIEVMDHVERTRGIHRFVLAGLCSGAENALTAAAADARVVGVAALEGYAYPTRQFWVRRYVPKLFVPGAWRRFFAGQHPLVRQIRRRYSVGEAIEGPFSLQAALGSRRLPPQQEVESLLKRLVSRRIPLLAIYAGGGHHYYNYVGQLRAAFPGVDFGDLLAVAYESRADHTFSDVAIRRRVIERVGSWVSARGLGRRAPAVLSGS